MKRPFIAGALGISASLCLFGATGFAQESKSQLIRNNNSTITANGNGSITGPVLNSLLGHMISSFCGIYQASDCVLPPGTAAVNLSLGSGVATSLTQAIGTAGAVVIGGSNSTLTSLATLSTLSVVTPGTITGPLSTSVSGIWQTAGSGVSLCNLAVTCANWPNMGFGASSVQVLNTSHDASWQENNGNFYMQVNTGLETPWAQSTAYVAGQIVDTGTYTYTETVASCTSASTGTGPSGQTSPQADGTCSWNFLGSQGLGVKNNLNVQTTVTANGGRSWNNTFGVHLQSGWHAPFAANIEMDMFNNSSIDPTIGSAYKVIDLLMQGSGGTNPITAFIHISPSSPGSHEGIWFDGVGLIDHTISDGSTSSISYYDTGTHATAGIVEGGSGPIGININGAFTSNAIQINGTQTGSAINVASTPSNGVALQMLQGDKVCFSGVTKCLFYTGTAIIAGSSAFTSQGDLSVAPSSGNANLYLNLASGGQSFQITNTGTMNFSDNTHSIVAMTINTSPLASALTLTSSGLQVATVAFGSTLPTCNGAALTSEVNISNANVNTWGSAITGAGSYNVRARCNGTNWTVLGI